MHSSEMYGIKGSWGRGGGPCVVMREDSQPPPKYCKFPLTFCCFYYGSLLVPSLYYLCPNDITGDAERTTSLDRAVTKIQNVTELSFFSQAELCVSQTTRAFLLTFISEGEKKPDCELPYYLSTGVWVWVCVSEIGYNWEKARPISPYWKTVRDISGQNLLFIVCIYIFI